MNKLKFKIAGINVNSFIDMKGKIAYMIFTEGCNMNCWYCHNRAIITSSDTLDYNLEDTLKDIERRKNFIDIVGISGGEPTLQPNLIKVIKLIRDIGLEIKLDSNGTNPNVIKNLIDEKLIDFISMDIKAPLEKYSMIDLFDHDISNDIHKSIDVIISSGIAHEFRTTFSPDLDVKDLIDISKLIVGADRYTIQQFKPCENMLKDLTTQHNKEEVEKTLLALNKNVITSMIGFY